jgi:NTE family protein
MAKTPVNGIVLSGGGARGAYEVGVLAGMIDVLGLRPGDPAPFQVYSGTSVGAINVSFLAANAHRGDLSIDDLVETWSNLNLETHLRLDLFGLTGFRDRLFRRRVAEKGRALIDPTALERVVQDHIPWEQLHRNVDAGHVHSLVVAALRVFDGQTTLFVETSPETEFRASRDPRRTAISSRINAANVLASASIPLIFPVRQVEGQWYCDGSLRSNTPIAPALRSGADRIMVVSLLHQDPERSTPPLNQPYPSPLVLLGKVLNALLLDPVTYDLQVLGRLNRILGVLDEALGPKSRAKVDAVTVDARGMPYRQVDTLIFSPSEDLGELAGQHLRDLDRSKQLGRLGGWLLRRAAREEASWELDLASYILFDGEYAQRLIEVGREDAHRRADEIRTFFSH